MGEDSAETLFSHRGQGAQRRVEQRETGWVRGPSSVVGCSRVPPSAIVGWIGSTIIGWNCGAFVVAVCLTQFLSADCLCVGKPR
jgi:hypothetical protein